LVIREAPAYVLCRLAVVPLFLSGEGAMNAVVLASIVVPLVILALVTWLFFRAARREDERNRV
jgi:ABC-type spermidine/putrescine transport system permease subunit II